MEAPARRYTRLFEIAAAVVVLALIIPVWLVPLPPLSDFINHVARAHVLAHPEIARYGEFYRPAWGPYPNLAFDLVAVPLAKLMPAMVAGKVFLTLTVTTFAAGCIYLGRAVLGASSFRPLIACFFAYSESFLLGYCNFTFGLGLALLAIGMFVRIMRRDVDSVAHGPNRASGATDAPPARKPPSALVFAAVAFLVVVSHAAAFVTMGLGVTGVLIAELWERKKSGRPLELVKLAKRAAPLAPAVLYFAVWLAAFADRSADKAFASVGTSARLLVLTILPTYNPKLDLAVVGIVLLVGAECLVFFKMRRVHLPMLIGALLLVAAVFMAPADFGGGYEANGRYVVGAWVLALFAPLPTVVPDASSSAKYQQLALVQASLVVAILVVRQVGIARAWQELGEEMRAQTALFDALPEGTHLGNLSFLDGKSNRAVQLRERATLHATAYAVISRQADVPTLYAIKGVQPIAHVTHRYDLHRFKADQPGPIEVTRIHEELDAALLCRTPNVVRDALLADGGQIVGVAGACQLVRWR